MSRLDFDKDIVVWDNWRGGMRDVEYQVVHGHIPLPANLESLPLAERIDHAAQFHPRYDVRIRIIKSVFNLSASEAVEAIAKASHPTFRVKP